LPKTSLGNTAARGHLAAAWGDRSVPTGPFFFLALVINQQACNISQTRTPHNGHLHPFFPLLRSKTKQAWFVRRFLGLGSELEEALAGKSLSHPEIREALSSFVPRLQCFLAYSIFPTPYLPAGTASAAQTRGAGIRFLLMYVHGPCATLAAPMQIVADPNLPACADGLAG
jgi:hypothetical protein